MVKMDISNLQQHRYAYTPQIPDVLQRALNTVIAEEGSPTQPAVDREALKTLFRNTYGAPIVEFKTGEEKKDSPPLRVGVILSGGQAPGGHNVIAGLFDGLKAVSEKSTLYGFLGGPEGLVKAAYIEIEKDFLDTYRNTGGFDIIGSGRTKIETDTQIAHAMQTAKNLNLHAIVIIGGDDSNTNAALLAEHFINAGSTTQVIGVPKTIDGDLKNTFIDTSFGFDTAVKTYAELIGNLGRDANSAKKYWHFIKLMGRSASHIALECALQTRPNVCLISEEIAAKNMTLEEVIDTIIEPIIARAEAGKNFGLVLIPEGVIEFIPEIKTLILEINDLMANHAEDFNTQTDFSSQKEWIQSRLSKNAGAVFLRLPDEIVKQLLMDRDPHGNVQVSRIETEKLIALLVSTRLAELAAQKKYTGKFSSYTHFFGYEGRCAFPSNFDANYCYALGRTALLLIAKGYTGYISSVRNVAAPVSQWICGGVPLTMMMNMEQRHGKPKPVIKKALVDLQGAPFKAFAQHRNRWAVSDDYRYPGAIQYYGPREVCDMPTMTLMLEQKKTSDTESTATP